MASHEPEPGGRLVRGRWQSATIAHFMHYTYVLRSLKDGKCYIGSTSDLRRRFAEHQRGEVSSTAPRRPFELIFYEAFLHHEECLDRERYFKTTKGKIALRRMLSKTLIEQS
jgi:putative endonuclease